MGMISAPHPAEHPYLRRGKYTRFAAKMLILSGESGRKMRKSIRPAAHRPKRRSRSGDRGYYTGICGLFDGKRLDSGVMIRFLEQPVGGAEGEYLFKSGGGITHRSDRGAEYEEMKKKVYVPLRRNDPDR